MKEREEMLPFSVVSALTGEFTEDFLQWWPFQGTPVFANHIDPYCNHVGKVIGLKYVFRPEKGGFVVPILSYCGMWRAQIMRVRSYRSWVDSCIKSLDNISGM